MSLRFLATRPPVWSLQSHYVPDQPEKQCNVTTHVIVAVVDRCGDLHGPVVYIYESRTTADEVALSAEETSDCCIGLHGL